MQIKPCNVIQFLFEISFVNVTFFKNKHWKHLLITRKCCSIFFFFFEFSLPLIACFSCRMEHISACSRKGPLTNVIILLAEKKIHIYFYEQVLKLDDILRFDFFLSFFPPNVVKSKTWKYQLDFSSSQIIN